MLSTWHRFHHEALETLAAAAPVLPVTIRSLVVVGALFKRGGYRSFDSYVSAIKGQHIEAGYGWTQLHAHTARWVSRSVSRGIGPARQSCSFDFSKLCLLPQSPEPLVTNGPQQPVTMALLASIFLLREVEVSTAVAVAWSFDHENLEISLNLPGSKSTIWPLECIGPGHVFAASQTSFAPTTLQLLIGHGSLLAPTSPQQMPHRFSLRLAACSQTKSKWWIRLRRLG